MEIFYLHIFDQLKGIAGISSLFLNPSYTLESTAESKKILMPRSHFRSMKNL